MKKGRMASSFMHYAIYSYIVSHQFPKEHYKKYEDIFQSLNVTGDGYLSEQEILEGMQEHLP